jgi:hypothetical protein
MNQSTRELNGKKPYAPPRLTTISLRPEEAVLGACKSLNTGGSTGGSCLIPIGGCITSNAGS